MFPLRATDMRRGADAAFRRRGVASIALAAVAGLVYLNALDNPFVYDDHRLVVENAALQRGFDLRALVLGSMTRPVINISYALDYALWGVQPFGYHLTNVLLHMLNVVLLFHLAWRAVDDRNRLSPQASGRPVQPMVLALAASLSFAVHPMMTGAVGYVAGRSEVLCGTFFLFALLAARRWMLGAEVHWWVLSTTLWIAALLTKEIAAMFPFVVLCYERFVLNLAGAERKRALLTMHLPLVALAIAAGAARLAVLALMEHPGTITSQWSFALVELDVFRRYLRLMLLPQGQTIFHAVPDATITDPGVIIGALAIAAIIFVAWRLRRTLGVASLGLFWFVLLLMPSAALVMLDQAEPMAEHRVYLASCGLFLAVGSSIEWLLARTRTAGTRRRVMARALIAAAAVVLAARTVDRNAMWSDPIALWREAVEKGPNHWLPRLLLGESLHVAGRRDEAIAEYTLAIKLRPEEETAYQKLALSLVEERRFETARVVFETLRRRDPLSPVASNGLGVVALVVGDVDRARAHFLQTLTNHPDNVPARQVMAQIAEMAPANHAEALRLCREIEQLAPETPGNAECIRRNESR